MIGFERKEEAVPPPQEPPPGDEEEPRVERRKVSLPWPKNEDWRKPDVGPGPGQG